MLQLKLKPGRKGRIWLDEIPPAVFTAQETHEIAVNEIKITNIACNKSHSVSIESLIFRGSQPIYGFLGATFYPDENQELLIQVYVGDGETSNLGEFLVTPPEILQVGLSQEYVSVILKRAVETHKEVGSMLSGKVIFNCAAHGAFSSNEIIFGFLSQTVINTFNLLCEEISSQEIVDFVESAINSF